MTAFQRGENILETITLEVREYWIELNDTLAGVLLQKVSGAIVYYLYSEKEPDRKRIGTVLNKTDNPVPLFGGKIWVRSEKYAVITYLSVPVDKPGLEQDIGDLTLLPTNNKESIVDAIVELEQRIAASESGGYHAFKHVVTVSEISNKQLLLPHIPVRESINIQPQMGIPQFLDIDFTLTGNIVNWDALALELLLQSGQQLFISYIKE